MADKDQVLRNMTFSNTDFDALKDDMLNLIPKIAPEWTNANDTDLGVALINVFCGIGDMLTYYINEQARESYLPTARLRDTVIKITNSVGYQLARPKSASTEITLRFSDEPRDSVITIYPYDIFTTADGVIPFVSRDEVAILPTEKEVRLTLLQGAPVREQFIATGEEAQEYTLDGTNVGQDMMMVTVGEGSTARTFYELTKDIYLQNGADKSYFMVRTDGFNRSTIQFTTIYGDDMPREGELITVTYLDSLGAGGRIIAGLVTETLLDLPTGTEINHDVAARNGADRESASKAKIQAPMELRSLWRAVTPSDYYALFNGYPGVKIAEVFDHETNRDISIHQVRVYVVPEDGGALTPHFRKELQDFADRIKMVTTEVAIFDAEYVPVAPKMELYIHNHVSQAKAIYDVTTVLEEQFALGTQQFGEAMRLSNLIAAVESVPGISYVNMTYPTKDIPIDQYQIAYVKSPIIKVGGVV